MAQVRKWNYKANDYTYDISNWQVGLYNRGRYRGFEALLGAGLTLQLIHTGTGVEIIDDNQAAPASLGKQGLWITTQGSIIKETAPILLPISAGGGLPRIDLIVGQHTYITTPGGAFAIYLVIQGTPNASPVAPALTFPNIQTVLGQLYVPAGMVNLNGAGVVYTPATVPDYANDSSIAHTERKQTWTAAQSFYSIENRFATITTITANQLVLPDDGSANIYYMLLAAPPAVSVRTTITGITPSIASIAAHARRVDIFSPYALLLSAAFVGADTYIEVNQWFTLIRKDSGVYTVEQGGEPKLGRVNKYQATQISKVTNIATVFLDSSGRLLLPTSGNVVYLGNNASPLNQLVAIQPSQTYSPTATDGGGIIELVPNSANDLLITPFVFTYSPNFKPIWTPNGLPIMHRGGTVIRLVEDLVYWRIVSWEAAWQTFATALSFVSGGGAVTITESTFRYQVTANRIEIECTLTVTITGVVSAFGINSPAAFVPKPTSIGVKHFAGITAADFTGAMVQVVAGPLLSIIKEGGNFAAGAGQNISFRMAYELNT